MDKVKEIVLPIALAVMMSVARNIKSGKVRIAYLIAEAITSFVAGYLGYYILTIWYNIEYQIACGFCGYLGYLSRDILEYLISFFKAVSTSFQKSVTKKIENES